VAAAPPSQSVLLASTAANLPYTAGASTTVGSWLSVSPATGSTPASLTVSVNPAGLGAGDYTGSITVTATGASNSPVTVTVTLTVRANSQLQVSPSQLSFHFQTGGSVPPGQTLSVSSNGSPLSYTVAATTTAGNWLLVNPVGGSTPGQVEVSVNPAGLAAGTYAGSVTVSSSGAANSPVTVSVSLTVSANPRLEVSPESLTFYFQTGGSAPAAQPIAVSSGSTALPFTVSFTTTSGGSWLVPSPLSGATSATVGVSVNPAGLSAGTYSGSVTITASGAVGSPRTVAVTLVVTSSALLTASPSTLTFNYQVGGAVPASQTLNLGSSSGSLNYNASATTSGGAWLAIGALTGTTPGSITATVTPTGLSPGTYTGAITITAVGAGNTPLVVAVRLVVSFSPLLVANPPSLSFAYQIGQAIPVSQSITITSTGVPLNFTAAVSTASGGGWLSIGATTGTTPAIFTVTVVPTALTAGTYEGTITLTGAGAGNSPLTVGVTLVVSNSALLVASPGFVVFDLTAGATSSVVRSVSLTATDGSALAFTVNSTTATGGNWLLVGPQNGSTPSTLSVSTHATGLTPGAYSGTITVTAAAAANSPQTIRVTLRVSSTATLAAAPATLSFTQEVGGAPPAPVNLAISSSGANVSFTVSATTASGVSWLSVTPSGGTTPATLSVLVNAGGLAAGSYAGTISVVSPDVANSPLQIPVTLAVGAAIQSSAANLTFNFQIGSPTPAAQAINLSASGGTALSFTAAAASAAGNWLGVSPAAGTTPATLSVTVNPAGLAAGTHEGTITIAASGAVNSPLTVAVRLIVTAAPAAPTITAVANAASFLPTSVSAGLIVTIFGTGIGPSTGVTLRLNSSGRVDTTLGETRVLFDEIPAPMVYASNRQVSAIVPYAIAGRFNTRLQIEYQGMRSNTIDLRVVDAAPGIFSLDSSGSGQGAILNQNFSVNGPNNAAARGSVVMIYATGEGQTAPAGIDGLVTSGTLRLPLQSVTVTIGGQAARVLYAGSAPGLVAGVLQVNAEVPEGVTPGAAVQVVVTIGGVRSQANVTMAVR
jgi:uncharacterized protein (TIGR03437 family)